jgi:hypothetical protein
MVGRYQAASEASPPNSREKDTPKWKTGWEDEKATETPLGIL